MPELEAPTQFYQGWVKLFDFGFKDNTGILKNLVCNFTYKYKCPVKELSNLSTNKAMTEIFSVLFMLLRFSHTHTHTHIYSALRKYSNPFISFTFYVAALC